jgi:hypothetical protein
MLLAGVKRDEVKRAKNRTRTGRSGVGAYLKTTILPFYRPKSFPLVNDFTLISDVHFFKGLQPAPFSSLTRGTNI